MGGLLILARLRNSRREATMRIWMNVVWTQQLKGKNSDAWNGGCERSYFFRRGLKSRAETTLECQAMTRLSKRTSGSQ